MKLTLLRRTPTHVRIGHIARIYPAGCGAELGLGSIGGPKSGLTTTFVASAFS